MNEQEKRVYQRGYSRGYNTGRDNFWPDYRPPLPPDVVTAALIKAAGKLCDGVDGICATLDEQDEFVIALGPLLDATRQALAGVTAANREQPEK